MYLQNICNELKKIWPDNKRVVIVCHGHSIPCGYMAENIVRPMDAYPQQLLAKLADRFPHAVCSVITTAIGGENSIAGAKRFESEVLSLNPRLVTIDYGRNDMFISKEEMIAAWSYMIEKAKENDVKVILITPALDSGEIYWKDGERKLSDEEISKIISDLSKKYEVGLADAHGKFEKLLLAGHTREEYCSSLNHINAKGHEVVMEEILKHFSY